jgi:hypothetical protein
LWGIAAVVLIESRNLITTPEITRSELHTLPATIADKFTDHETDLLVAGAVSMLGVLCLVVFVTRLAHELSVRLPADSSLPRLVLVGGAITGAATFVGYSAFALMAQAADDEVNVATYVAVQASANGLAYIGYTAMALVTGAVAAAGLRSTAVPRWLAAFSTLATVVLLAATFLPFVSWLPALVWTLVVSIGLLLRRPQSPSSPGIDDETGQAALPVRAEI